MAIGLLSFVWFDDGSASFQIKYKHEWKNNITVPLILFVEFDLNLHSFKNIANFSHNLSVLYHLSKSKFLHKTIAGISLNEHVLWWQFMHQMLVLHALSIHSMHIRSLCSGLMYNLTFKLISRMIRLLKWTVFWGCYGWKKKI